MVEISKSGSGEGPGWATAPGYSTIADQSCTDKGQTLATRGVDGQRSRHEVESPSKYKTKYRVINWAAYDRALVQRGDITLWISEDAMCSSWSGDSFRSVTTWRAEAG